MAIDKNSRMLLIKVCKVYTIIFQIQPVAHVILKCTVAGGVAGFYELNERVRYIFKLEIIFYWFKWISVNFILSASFSSNKNSDHSSCFFNQKNGVIYNVDDERDAMTMIFCWCIAYGNISKFIFGARIIAWLARGDKKYTGIKIHQQ